MNIRDARLADLHAIVQLRSKLWPEQTSDHPREIGNYFSNCSKDIVKIYVAENSTNQVVGYIELNLRNFAEGSVSRYVPYIEGWFVESESRRQGVGKKLILQAQIWALNAGFNELASDTDLDNESSIEIHKLLGFKEVYRIVCFIKKLNRK